ncbi:hypothetical protein NET02_05310 [Thermomicrobiaceae bacterium CFH 74404]|uniref:RnfC Barrel sandwich hybrid domain-containing protein n=1 Tax=Thermalbibacter longus TaxID=2951981 RepID=A0AA41WAC7_9BACT|nr:hypothetical protein [Thermalbibacter longus]MCM8748556.1 hypothetical protein [Thermalbibacter longus]
MERPLVEQVPALTRDVTLHIERRAALPGEVRVPVGARVEPATVVLSAPSSVPRPVTVHVARELGLSPGVVRRHLTRPLGSQVTAGEPIASARRGLRTAQVTAPITGQLAEVDEQLGTVTVTPAVASVEYAALVHGDVIEADEAQRVTIKASGDRVAGAVLLGKEVYGPLRVLTDRPDRELPPDAIDERCRGAVVVAGMTVSSAALRRMASLGVAGVIVGSLSATSIQAVLGISGSDAQADLWAARLLHGSWSGGFTEAPVSVLVTEGFGRRPMARPLFDALATREGHDAALLFASSIRGETRPACLITRAGATGGREPVAVPVRDGVRVRLTDPGRLGQVGVCRGDPVLDLRLDGVARWAVVVEFDDGARRLVPLANLEVLVEP